MNKQDSISSSSSADKQKNKFKNWLKSKIKPDGTTYSDNTIPQYITALSRAYNKVFTGEKSVFEITDVNFFRDVVSKIKKNNEWDNLNINYNCSSAIKLYDEFLGECSKSLETSSTNTPVSEIQAPQIDKPRNLIVFGAPGTGKSHKLEKYRINSFGDNYERVTFYPSYSYSQFVGCYKPVMNGENISYSFVPGPFLRTYVNAVKHPSKNYLLIIEEINRADAASVFGDVFQLLDRNQEGKSVYSISTSEDIKKYLEEQEISSDKLSIPSNMYIWATMNSADQGVFPMDTAFKRRWDFLYFDLDGNPIGDDPNCPVTKSDWEDIRKAINNWLCEKKVNEDKHLGKYFLNVEKNVEEKDFRHAFKNKVLMYLYEDAARAFRSELFENNSFSAILRDFNTIGTGIFKPESIKKSIAKRVDNGEERANE